ncbi:hypothetical protein ACFL45_08480 [Candidatus Neomarinimicrobiota bacterium]
MPNQALTGESLAGLVNLLSEGLEHPLLIVKKRAINLSTISINKNILGDVERNKEQCDRLLLNLSRMAQDPPYHPGLNLGEGASFCISMLPPKVLEIQPEIDLRQEIPKRITGIIQRGYGTNYAPNIFLARNESELKTKLEEHAQKRGDDLHYQLTMPGARDCLYSNVLKTCLVTPRLVERLEGRRDDRGLLLRSFERIIHELTHGLIENVQEGGNTLSYPLEEFIVTMAAHQLTAEFANEIAGDDITSEQYRDFLVNGRVTFLPPSHEMRKTIFFRSDSRKYHKQIARYFISKLNSKEGINELNVLGE